MDRSGQHPPASAEMNANVGGGRPRGPIEGHGLSCTCRLHASTRQRPNAEPNSERCGIVLHVVGWANWVGNCLATGRATTLAQERRTQLTNPTRAAKEQRLPTTTSQECAHGASHSNRHEPSDKLPSVRQRTRAPSLAKATLRTTPGGRPRGP